jgi:hypothetical protein
VSPEQRFRYTLDSVRRDSDACVQFLYAWVAFHYAAARNQTSRRKINENALYWNTILGGLQTSLFIALGRLFDRDKKSHGLDKLLRIATIERQIFSPSALARRKAQESPGANWINSYAASAHVPTAKDFARVRRHIASKRRIYIKNYAPIRNRVFAHSALGSLQKVDALFSRTNLGELQRLVLSVCEIHDVFWQLYFNGHLYKPRRPVFTTKALLRRARKVSGSTILPLPQEMVKRAVNVVNAL